mmetsp:Transcript_51911/g.123566  ORF Transcript_51911/g.123566 Transcript_51911/m.123566 type:complete len:205 (-) Transcript_51911:32-646(-)
MMKWCITPAELIWLEKKVLICRPPLTCTSNLRMKIVMAKSCSHARCISSASSANLCASSSISLCLRRLSFVNLRCSASWSRSARRLLASSCRAQAANALPLSFVSLLGTSVKGTASTFSSRKFLPRCRWNWRSAYLSFKSRQCSSNLLSSFGSRCRSLILASKRDLPKRAGVCPLEITILMGRIATNILQLHSAASACSEKYSV